MTVNVITSGDCLNNEPTKTFDPCFGLNRRFGTVSEICDIREIFHDHRELLSCRINMITFTILFRHNYYVQKTHKNGEYDYEN